MNIRAGTVAFPAVILVLGGAIGTRIGGEKSTAAVNGSINYSPPVPVVAVARPTRADITRTISLPATINAYEEATLYGRTAGYVSSVEVDKGDIVKKGQVLAVISAPETGDDVTEAQATCLEAQAQLSTARSDLDAAFAAHQAAKADFLAAQSEVAAPKQRVESARAGLDAARMELRSAQAELAKAKSDESVKQKTLERYRDLRTDKSVTQQALDEVEGSYQQAKSAVDAASANAQAVQAKVRSEEAKVGASEGEVTAVGARASVSEANIARAKAAIGQAESRVKAAEARLSVCKAGLAHALTIAGFSRITAPFDGVVTKRLVDAGALVSPGTATPILVVARTDRLRVYLDVPESEVPRVKIGAPVAVEVKELTDRKIDGHIVRTAGALDPVTRTLRAEVELENSSGRLKAGMFATVKLGLERQTSVLSVPAEAVAAEKDKRYLYVLNGGKVKKTRVVTGADDGIDVEVISGLSADKDVVISGTGGLSDGAEVRVSRGGER
ncbi:MAG: efflux RND transporter periplasmic adaptor subunit [Armatimonadetes bacterium]|nr:efflux RND transporter periplasmic adaptor subunit [Armatimonadota bacterium]